LSYYLEQSDIFYKELRAGRKKVITFLKKDCSTLFMGNLADLMPDHGVLIRAGVRPHNIEHIAKRDLDFSISEEYIKLIEKEGLCVRIMEQFPLESKPTSQNGSTKFLYKLNFFPASLDNLSGKFLNQFYSIEHILESAKEGEVIPGMFIAYEVNQTRNGEKRIFTLPRLYIMANLPFEFGYDLAMAQIPDYYTNLRAAKQLLELFG